MSSTPIYCVYITHYSGDLMPPNYIGSSTVNKINQGYRGSIKSKKYKSIWKSELKQNPHLFSTEIISYHDTRREATHKELQLQRIFNVVKNDLFINMAYAVPNGYFGRDVSGENNPMYKSNKRGILAPYYGKKHSTKTKLLISEKGKGRIHSKSTKEKISKSQLGKIIPEWVKNKQSITMINKFKNKSIIWINNNIIEKMIDSSESIPNGFHPGRIPKKRSPNKNKEKSINITNGIINKRIKENEEIPFSFYRGQIQDHKK